MHSLEFRCINPSRHTNAFSCIWLLKTVWQKKKFLYMIQYFQLFEMIKLAFVIVHYILHNYDVFQSHLLQILSYVGRVLDPEPAHAAQSYFLYFQGIEQLKKDQGSWHKKSYWLSIKSVFGHPFSWRWFSPFSKPNYIYFESRLYSV